MAEQDMPELGEISSLLRDSKYADKLADPQRRRAKLFEMLSQHRDPVWREIGEQLRDGKMTLREVVAVEAYRERYYDALTKNRERFVGCVAAAKQHLEVESSKRGDGA